MLDDVEVERIDAGTVVVRWKWADERREPVTVMVSTGLGASLDPAGPGVVVADADSVTLEIPPTPRHVFEVSTGDGQGILVAERRLSLAGTLNFRDLGGYVGTEGRRVRWGLVYRSDNLGSVSVEGWNALVDLGLRSVYDLRHDVERSRAPVVPPEDLAIATRWLPIGGEAAEAPDVVELLRMEGRAFDLDFMITLNQTLLFRHASVFGTLLADLGDPAHLPAVFHCTAGKDRTGVAAALLLSALGVDRETVLDDYELTTRYRSNHRIAELRPRLEAAGIDVEAVRPFLSAPRPALEAALATVDAEFGDVCTYLTRAAGVAPATLESLRATLLA